MILATPPRIRKTVSIEKPPGDTKTVAPRTYPPDSDRSRRSCLSVLDDARVSLRYAASTEVLRIDAIVLVRSAGNSTLIVTEDGEHSVRATTSFVVEQLEPFGFVRVHRGTAVHMSRVQRLVTRGRHRVSVVLDTGVEVTVGREFQHTIRVLLGAKTQRRSRSS
jgi:DNA-binding LytR/AlgR family response regulator